MPKELLSQTKVMILLLVIFLASSWSLFQPQFFRVHDYTHAARIVEMTEALRQGQFPARWVSNLGYGFGMPLFEFYAPLPYYVGALWYWLGIDLVITIKLLMLTANAGTVIGAYLLAKTFVTAHRQAAGVLTSVAVTLAPYRAVNLFVRGALAEVWGMMFFPWILFFILKIIQSKQRKLSDWAGLTLSLAGLFLSHNLMSLIFAPFAVLFGVFMAWYYLALAHHLSLPNFLKLQLYLLSSYLMAAGLAAFYLAPALIENSLTQINSILTGYFDYSQHFLYLRQFVLPNWGYGGSEWGPTDGISFFWGWGQLILVIILVLAILINLVLRKRAKLARLWPGILVGGLAASSFFLCLYRSKVIWDSVLIAKYIQFPWRMMAVGLVMLGLLMGWGFVYLLPLIKKPAHQLLFFKVILILLIMNAIYFRPEKYLNDPAEFYYSDPELIQKQMSQILPDYIPSQVDVKEAAQIPAGSRLSVDQRWVPRYDEAELKINYLVDRGQQKLLATEFDRPLVVGFKVAEFPGWRLELDGQAASYQIGSLGNIEVAVPAGARQVGLFWGSTPVRLASDLVSLASWLLFLGLVVKFKKDD